MRRVVIFLAGIRWNAPDRRVQHGGWVVLEGRGCVYSVVTGPFATREDAERAEAAL